MPFSSWWIMIILTAVSLCSSVCLAAYLLSIRTILLHLPFIMSLLFSCMLVMCLRMYLCDLKFYKISFPTLAISSNLSVWSLVCFSYTACVLCGINPFVICWFNCMQLFYEPMSYIVLCFEDIPHPVFHQAQKGKMKFTGFNYFCEQKFVKKL